MGVVLIGCLGLFAESNLGAASADGCRKGFWRAGVEEVELELEAAAETVRDVEADGGGWARAGRAAEEERMG